MNLKTQVSSAKLKVGPGGGAGGDGNPDADDFDVWMKSRQLLRPEDQLDLTDAELSEEITKMLTPTNTNVLHNLVVYSFKDEAFVTVSNLTRSFTIATLIARRNDY